jgi:hypothetical protein
MTSIKISSCSAKGNVVPIREDTGDLPIGEIYYDREIYNIESTDPKYSHISVRSGLSPHSPPGWVEINRSSNDNTKYITITCAKLRPVITSTSGTTILSDPKYINIDANKNINWGAIEYSAIESADLKEQPTRTNRTDEITKIEDPSKPWANPLSWTTTFKPKAGIKPTDNRTYKKDISSVLPGSNSSTRIWEYQKNGILGKTPSTVNPELYKVLDKTTENTQTTNNSELTEKEIIKESFYGGNEFNWIENNSLLLFICMIMLMYAAIYAWKYIRSSAADRVNSNHTN